MKFIHMADLHLGSPFAGIPAEAAAARYAWQFDVLDASLRAAATARVRLVLISGDVFDDTVMPQKTVSGFFERLASYPGISFVIAPGNHDYYTPEGYYSESNTKIPRNVFIFRAPELTKIPFDELNADVYGFAFTSDGMFGAPALHTDAAGDGRTKILCCHAALDDPTSPYCPLYTSSLGIFDYVALGHIHARRVTEYGKTTIAYPGCPEGRDFGESGRKGILLVNTDGGISVSFLRMQGVTYRTEEIDISDMTESGSLRKAAVAAALEGDDAETRGMTALRIILSGTCRPELDLSADLLTAALRFETRNEPFLSLEVRDETVPGYSAAELEKDISLRGSFFRALRPELESRDPDVRRRAARALRMGLNAIDGLPVMR